MLHQPDTKAVQSTTKQAELGVIGAGGSGDRNLHRPASLLLSAPVEELKERILVATFLSGVSAEEMTELLQAGLSVKMGHNANHHHIGTDGHHHHNHHHFPEVRSSICHPCTIRVCVCGSGACALKKYLL